MNDQTQPTQTWRLLCVDDEANILSALRRMLRMKGYQVSVATSGAEALQMLEEESFDLVISDMRMPEMDGAQFLEQVRQRWPDTIRILLTGYADISSTVDAINKGEIYRYISKPWDDNDLLLILRDALARKELEREKARLEALTAQQNEELKDLNANLELKVMERTVELRRAHDKLKTSFLTSLKIFSNLIELRGPMLSGHSRRVAELARRIATRMNLPAPDIQDIFVAGLLHDIGKIGLADDLLSKPVTQMTGDELGAYKKHTVKGEQSLMGLDELRNAAKLIRGHHERFDGQGFPDGLSGLGLPLGAGILAIANDFDSLQIGTLAARRFNRDEAAKMVADGRGKRYDPRIVDAFLDVLGKVESTPAETELTPLQLEAGMTLNRDLVTKDGILLLAADYVLDANLIRQIREYARSEGVSLKVWVRLPGATNDKTAAR